MCWRGNFNSTERYLPSLMFLIEPIWTRQPVSQLAAQLGSLSYCGLHSCGTFDNDVRPSEAGQHSLYIFSNLLVIGLDGSGCFWTRTVIPHERVGGSLMVNITLSARQFVTVRETCWYTPLSDRSRRSSCCDISTSFEETEFSPAGGQDGCRWEPAGPLRSLPHSSHLFLPLLNPFGSPSQGLFHIELLEIPPRLLKGILHWQSAAISAGHAIWRRTTTTSFQSFGHLKND